MNNDITHRAFLGDAERDFCLGAKQIHALEDKLGIGTGALYQRLARLEFSFADIVEVIRHALIGGGASPSEADSLVRHWVADRPIAETYPLAFDILDRRWNGVPIEPAGDSAPAEPEAQ